MLLEVDDTERAVLNAALDTLSTAAVTGTTGLTEDEVEEAIERLSEKVNR